MWCSINTDSSFMPLSQLLPSCQPSFGPIPSCQLSFGPIQARSRLRASATLSAAPSCQFPLPHFCAPSQQRLLPILLAASSRAPCVDLSQILFTAPLQRFVADSFGCAIARPSRRFVVLRHRAPLATICRHSFGCAGAPRDDLPQILLAAPLRAHRNDLLYSLLAAPLRAPLATINIVYYFGRHRALATIYIVDSFGPRDVLSILLAPIARTPLATIRHQFFWLCHRDDLLPIFFGPP